MDQINKENIVTAKKGYSVYMAQFLKDALKRLAAASGESLGNVLQEAVLNWAHVEYQDAVDYVMDTEFQKYGPGTPHKNKRAMLAYIRTWKKYITDLDELEDLYQLFYPGDPIAQRHIDAEQRRKDDEEQMKLIFEASPEFQNQEAAKPQDEKY